MRPTPLGVIVLVILASASCAKAPGRKASGNTADQLPSATLPSFHLVTDSLALEEAVEAPSSPIAITEDGLIVLTTSSETARIRVVDTNGTVRAAFARTGRGPGEIQVPAALFVSGNKIYMYDMANVRLVGFGLEGTWEKERQFNGAVFPFSVGRDSVDFLAFSPEGRLEIRRSDLTGGASRILLDHRDTTFTRQFPTSFEGSGRRPIYPARASSPSRIAIGDPTTYRIVEWNLGTGKPTPVFGRTLPRIKRTDQEVGRELDALRGYHDASGRTMDAATIAARREQIENQEIPYFFALRGLRFDAKGRLLVVGAQHDSAVVDVFADTSFVGRIALECAGFAGSWAFARGWAAFICDSESGPVVKVFHVDDSDADSTDPGRSW